MSRVLNVGETKATLLGITVSCKLNVFETARSPLIVTSLCDSVVFHLTTRTIQCPSDNKR